MSSFAKQALSLKHAYVAALLAGVTAAAGAQSGPGPMGEGPRMQHGMGMGMSMEAAHGGPGNARMQARMAEHHAKRQAELKAKLKLAPEQEAAWATFSAAMAPPANPAQTLHPDRAELERLSTPERIDKMRALHEQHHTAMTQIMDKRAEAAKAFYSTLSTEQKKTFDAETLKGGGRHHGHRAGKGPQH